MPDALHFEVEVLQTDASSTKRGAVRLEFARLASVFHYPMGNRVLELVEDGVTLASFPYAFPQHDMLHDAVLAIQKAAQS